MRIKLPGQTPRNPLTKRVYRKGPGYDKFRWDFNHRPCHLNRLWESGIRLGEKRYMTKGRTRLKLEIKKAVALEAHELQQLARENAVAAMNSLIDITKNKRAPESSRIAASQVILDRGYGKASHITMTANIGNGKTSDITADELDKRVKQTLQRVEELTGRTGKARTSPQGPVDLRKLN